MKYAEGYSITRHVKDNHIQFLWPKNDDDCKVHYLIDNKDIPL